MNPDNRDCTLSEHLATKFKKSPLCTVSLSSKELFHSNFLAWLLETADSGFASKLFDKPDLKVVRVDREKHNFDLVVETNRGRIIVENKVKSIPDYGQIGKYLEHPEAKDAEFFLLSLVSPSAKIIKDFHQKVKFLDYKKVEQILQQTTSVDPYVRFLLEDYLLLLRTLLAVRDEAAIDDRPESLKESLIFPDEVKKRLHEIRLLDVAQKIRFCSLEKICTKELISLIDLKPPEVGLTNAQALLTYRWRATGRFDVGVQIQGGQYRRFVEAPDKSDVSGAAERLAKDRLWIFGDNKGERLLKFGIQFRYRYTQIENHSVEDLLGLLKDDFGELHRNADDVRRILEH